MKFGLAFANIITFAERDGLVALTRGAEAAGFESVWTVEHVIYPEGYGSTYPKFLGGLGLVFEQASARGHVQQSSHHGELTFALETLAAHEQPAILRRCPSFPKSRRCVASSSPT